MGATKECSECGENLSLEMFSKDKSKRSGHQSYCRECSTEYRRGWEKRLNAEELKRLKEQAAKSDKKRRKEFPEGKKAISAVYSAQKCKRMRKTKPGHDLHHMCYKEKFHLYTLEVTEDEHVEIHLKKNMVYDKANMIFKTGKGKPLKTIKEHREHVESIVGRKVELVIGKKASKKQHGTNKKMREMRPAA